MHGMVEWTKLVRLWHTVGAELEHSCWASPMNTGGTVLCRTNALDFVKLARRWS